MIINNSRILLTCLLFCAGFLLTGQPLKFSNCALEDGSCHSQMLKETKELFKQAASREMKYALNDSIYITFSISEAHKVEIIDTYGQFSGVLEQLLAEIIVDNLPNRLHKAQAAGTFSMSFNYELTSSFKRSYIWLEHAEKFPLVKDCQDFNEKGQRACLRYLSNLLLNAIKEQTQLDSKGTFTLFIDGNQLKGIEYTLPFGNNLIHDYLTLNLDTIFQQYLVNDKTDGDRLIRMKIDYDPFLGKRKSSNLADSTLAYKADMEHLENLKGQKNNEFYLMRTFDLSSTYFTKQPELKKEFIRLKLQEIGLQNATEIYIPYTGKRINMDSLYNYEPSEENRLLNFAKVESVPVFKGCEEGAENDVLKNCFQLEIMRFVAGEFKFPETARKQGIGGKMYISFVVEKDGNLGSINVARMAHPLLDFEGIRVISEIPQLTAPAKQNGKAVRMSFMLPINAKLQ